MVGGTCVPSLNVTNTTINQLESKVSLKNNVWPNAICCCLQTCNVVASEVMVADTYVPLHYN